MGKTPRRPGGPSSCPFNPVQGSDSRPVAKLMESPGILKHSINHKAVQTHRQPRKSLVKQPALLQRHFFLHLLFISYLNKELAQPHLDTISGLLHEITEPALSKHHAYYDSQCLPPLLLRVSCPPSSDLPTS
jgi:hypothetical protein